MYNQLSILQYLLPNNIRNIILQFEREIQHGRRGSESVQTPDMGCMNLKVGFSQNFQNSGLD